MHQRMLTRGTIEGSKYYWVGIIGQGHVGHFVEVFDVPPSPQISTCPPERISRVFGADESSCTTYGERYFAHCNLSKGGVVV